MFEKVKEILEEYTENNIVPESTLAADLELDSFSIVSIITEFEDGFDIRISDREISQLVTVKDIVDYLTKRVEEV